MHDEDQFQSYCNKVFAGWDFCITDLNAARLKHRSLLYELQVSNCFIFFTITICYLSIYTYFGFFLFFFFTKKEKCIIIQIVE